MNNKWVLLLIAFALVFSACQQPAAPAEPEQTAPEVPEVPTPPPVEEVIDQTPEEDTSERLDDPLDMFRTDEAPTAAVGGDALDIQERVGDKAAKGYAYVYEEIVEETGLLADKPAVGKTVYVRDDKVALEWTRRVYLTEEELYINWLSTDLEFNTGTAWCNDSCPSQEAFMWPAEEFDHPLAHEWITGLESATQQGEQTRGGVPAIQVDAVVNGEAVEMWIQSFSGLPIEVKTPERTYRYKELYTSVSTATFQAPE